MGFISSFFNVIPLYVYVPIAVIGSIAMLRYIGELEDEMSTEN